MKKLAIITALYLTTVAAFAQSRPTLAILPFTGGRDGEGETLAELFSFDQTLNGAFTPVPRTSINSAIQREQTFQMASGMTDPETISRIGKQLGARYIVAGSITRLGGQQLVVIAIMQIENLQQIAGEWLTYNDISEVRRKLPDMAKNIVAASRNNTSRLQKLAVLPFQTPSGDREADALAQILAAEIIRTGTYAVFPRTKTLEQVQAEYNTQTSGITDDYNIAAIGRGDNPLLALSGAARRLGQDRMFNAAIINVESGAQIKGNSVEYQIIEDGPDAIRKLTFLLTARIGDKGPGGGIVFFVEGGKYMECSEELGAYNWYDAVNIAKSYRGGGFTDWQLPDKSEIELMYKNLHQKGLGGFRNGYYWYGRSHWYLFDFGNQPGNSYTQNTSANVRAIRSFGE